MNTLMSELRIRVAEIADRVMPHVKSCKDQRVLFSFRIKHPGSDLELRNLIRVQVVKIQARKSLFSWHPSVEVLGLDWLNPDLLALEVLNPTPELETAIRNRKVRFQDRHLRNWYRAGIALPTKEGLLAAGYELEAAAQNTVSQRVTKRHENQEFERQAQTLLA